MIDAGALRMRSYNVRKRFLGMYRKANAGHIGCSLSCTDILVYLKFAWMEGNDSLVLSKGHAAAGLYSIMAEAGQLSEEEIDAFYLNGTTLPAHPPVNTYAAIPFATGSLGHGLSLCAGMALGARMKGDKRRIFCVTSDGELNEGSVWEAALFLSQNRLTNVFWLIDRNGIQGIGRTEDIMRLEPLRAKLDAFGFHAVEANGHDFNSLDAARRECEEHRAVRGMPCAVICSTVKGHGVSFMENTVDCHYLPMNEEQYNKALVELNAKFGAMPEGGMS